MSTSKVLLIALSLFGAVALGFLIGNRGAKTSDAPVVRSYMVPPERGDEIKAQINRLLEHKEADPIGRAQVFANGLLILRAPEGIQSGVQKFIDQLSQTKGVPRSTIHIDYWLVNGQEDKASNADSIPALSPVLEGITKVDGPRRFRILEHLSSNSMSGMDVEIKGAISEGKSMAAPKDDLVYLKMEFKSWLGSVKTETQAKAGEFLILGQNAATNSNRDKDAHLQGTKVVTGNVYYIIRATLTQ